MNSFIPHYMDPYSLGNGQFGKLYEVSKEEGVSQETIAKRRNVGKAAVAKSIKRLIENYYLYRVRDKQDGRAWCLFCTEKGWTVVQRINELVQLVKKQFTEGSTEEEMRIFIKVNDKITENVERYMNSSR